MAKTTRRQFLQASASAFASLTLGPATRGQAPGDRPKRSDGVTVLNPRNRVPLSFIIDDSTCLVNLAHFCIPHFHEAFPDRYPQPWKTLPREIPDSFVRKFGEWCHQHGIKGKYSLIPYPACVGWLDRDIPGWSKRELEESLKLVRTLMEPDWDFHPEMVTHTWVIDTKTGRPYSERSDRFMENWRWTDDKSADQIAEYMAYAMRVLKNVGIRCEGITTPGGFGGRVLPQLSQATLEACRDVFQIPIPHYFKHVIVDDKSVAPRVEFASGLDGNDPKCVVSIIACTGDWFGGWDGLVRGSVDQFISADLKGGRLPAVIHRGEPAILLCHWPGIYFNGEEVGFNIFKEVVRRLHTRFDNLIWMKLSEISRYWAAKELTHIERQQDGVRFYAPFACPSFTVKIAGKTAARQLIAGNHQTELKEASGLLRLKSGTWVRQGNDTIVCFDLPKGRSELVLG